MLNHTVLVLVGDYLIPTFDIFKFRHDSKGFWSFSICGLVFFVLNSLLGIAKQWSREKFAILTLKPRSRVRILRHRTWAFLRYLS